MSALVLPVSLTGRMVPSRLVGSARFPCDCVGLGTTIGGGVGAT